MLQFVSSNFIDYTLTDVLSSSGGKPTRISSELVMATGVAGRPVTAASTVTGTRHHQYPLPRI